MEKSVNFIALIGGGRIPEVLIGTWIVMGILTRISVFRWSINLVKCCKALDRRGFGDDQGGAEVERRWVRHKIGHFNFRSIAG